MFRPSEKNISSRTDSGLPSTQSYLLFPSRVGEALHGDSSGSYSEIWEVRGSLLGLVVLQAGYRSPSHIYSLDFLHGSQHGSYRHQMAWFAMLCHIVSHGFSWDNDTERRVLSRSVGSVVLRV